MRTTVRIDDDLLRELKRRAHASNLSLAKLVNQAIRQGLRAAEKPRRAKRFRQKVFDMGEPRINVDKALSVAGALEDEEIIGKIFLRK
jgi:Ribbon-helix-helix protein, copG family